MKFCQECGANVDGKKFCSECGIAINRESAPLKAIPINKISGDAALKEANKEKIKQNLKKDNLKLIIGIVIAVIFLFVLPNAMRSNVNKYLQESSQTTVSEPTESEFKSSCMVKIYDDLARHPDLYKSDPLLISGKVVQVLTKSNGAEYRVAMDGDYDKMVYVDYVGAFVQGNILENDTVSFYGTYDGLMSYTATIGGKITIPSLDGKYYQLN